MISYVRGKQEGMSAVIALKSGPIRVSTDRDGNLLTDRPITQTELDTIFKALKDSWL